MKKFKLFQTKFTPIVLLVLLLLSSLAGRVSARDNFAFSVASLSGDIDTVKDMNDAANAYANAGYHSYGVTDPTAQTLWDNLYADVQFFSSHGNVNNVQFSQTGIIVGNSGYFGTDDGDKYFIGTNDVHWDADTILVTYSNCNSAGANNNTDYNSISCKTAEKGADVTVGFRNEINSGSATNWNARYNQKLGEGYGVNDAVDYANSFIYLFPNVKTALIWHHGNANMKIGRYRSAGTGLGEDRNILNTSSRQLVHSDIESISAAIESVYPNFDINNYEISNIDGTKAIEVNTKEISTETSYIDLQFKIGEFYTEAGYTVEINNNIVTAIYDNNVDKQKQESLSNARTSNNARISDSKIEELKQLAKQQLLEKYDNKVNVNDSDITYKYYYDISTDKKFIMFSIPNTIENIKDMSGLAIDTIEIEI